MLPLVVRVRNAYANHGIRPFKVKSITRTKDTLRVVFQELPDDLTAREWLPIYDKSVHDASAGKEDVILYIGACTIVSVAVATILHCDIMRVSISLPCQIIKVNADSGKEEVIQHTHHMVLTKCRDNKRFVLDFTGQQFEWPSYILNAWVPLETYTSVADVVVSEILSPATFLVWDDEKTDAEKDHQQAMRNMIRALT